MADPRADQADAFLSVNRQQPSRNAFAEEALSRDRYMLATNAFYQREFSHREATPPSMVHPALRNNFDLLNPTQPLPKLDPAEVQHHMAQHRDSDMTAMSPFLTAGHEASPVLNLGTTPEHTPQPTQRAFIEDHRERQARIHSGHDDARVSVYRHAPKPAAEDFVPPLGASTKKTDEWKSDQQTPAPKSPKKGFLSRFAWSARGKTATPPPPSYDGPEPSDSTPMSVKARAVLVDPPPKRGGLTRSPSKPKRLFFRRTSDAAQVISATKRSDPPRAATSLGHRTPPNVTWQLPQRPRSNSNSKKELAGPPPHTNDEQTERNTRANAVSWSQSVKYLGDNKPPPTPPAKDTPPEEDARQARRQQLKLGGGGGMHQTPTRPPPPPPPPPAVTPSTFTITPASGQDSFGHRGPAQLVTQPSMYSLRASVVPDAMDKPAFDEAKSRLNGLGLEGFSMPDECKQGQSGAKDSYTPSMYSPDTFHTSVCRFAERAVDHTLRLLTSSQALGEPSPLGHLAQDSHSTTGTIPVVYPELASDPSIASTPQDHPPPSPPQHAGELDRAFVDAQGIMVQKEEQGLGIEVPVSPASEASTDGLFAIPLMRTPRAPEASPMSHHPSAMPSPLRNSEGEVYLPPTTYQPPAPVWKKKTKKDSGPARRVRLQDVTGARETSDAVPSPDDLPWTPSGRPKPKPSIFDNKPEWVHATESLVTRQSPPIGGDGEWVREEEGSMTNPRPSLPTRSPSSPSPQPRSLPRGEELEQLEQLSDTVLAIARARESALEQMTDRARAEHARLHQRLASLEIRLSPPKPELCYGDHDHHHEEEKPRPSPPRAEKQKTPKKKKNKKRQQQQQPPPPPPPPTRESGERVSAGAAHDFSRPPSPRRASPPSPAGRGHPHPHPHHGTHAPPPAPAAVDQQLYALLHQQQRMMLDLMQEIRDLKRAG